MLVPNWARAVFDYGLILLVGAAVMWIVWFGFESEVHDVEGTESGFVVRRIPGSMLW